MKKLSKTIHFTPPTISKEKAQALMNEFGKKREAFFFMLDFELQKPIVLSIQQIRQYPIYWEINGLRSISFSPFLKNYQTLDPSKEAIKLAKFPINPATYHHAFQLVQSEINQGNSYLLNLTFPTPIELNLSLSEIYTRSQAKYKLLIYPNLVLFSPETFVQIKEGQIASFPMKGTIDATIPNAAEIILADKKEKAEHCTIVDLIRNDLNLVASKVRVDQFRYIDHLQTAQKSLLQVSSKISGTLPINYQDTIGDILMRLLPAGSVSGAPKKKTVEIIRNAEAQDRGYYTGIFGFFDGNNLDSGVMIRYIEKIGDQLVYRSGGGITTHSNWKSEYQELIDKVYVPIY